MTKSQRKAVSRLRRIRDLQSKGKRVVVSNRLYARGRGWHQGRG